MDRLPIDIHSNKLLDWLISRRHCKKSWQNLIPPIREKISHAIQDMPENERIVALLRRSYINYFHCKEIMEILKETEKNSKNIFGYYSSQRMKDWQEIITSYEKDSTYLAEATQYLQRSVQYEVPTLRKQISKAENGLKDSERKEEEYHKQCNSAKKQYEKDLEKLGIRGRNIRVELLSLTADLPNFLAKVSAEIHGLSTVLDYFDGFRLYASGRENTYSEKSLPLLRKLIAKNLQPFTYYEWKYGEPPERTETLSLADLLANEGAKKGSESEIDFGDDDLDGEIDFEEDVAVAEDTGKSEFDIEIIDNEEELRKKKTTAKVARGYEALSVLENTETLAIVLSELTELQSFLHFRRMDERADSASDIYLSGIANKPPELSACLSTIEGWIGTVDAVVSALKNPQKTQLFKICSSPAFVDELVEQLEQKRLLADKYAKMAELMVDKQRTCAKQAVDSQEMLNGLIDATKTLQENIEKEISRRYNDREVYIIGEINTVLYGA